MSLKFSTLASGSSGNSYLICSDTTALLIDCGTAGKNIIKGIEDAGLSMEDLDGIFLTHEHQDHIKSIRMISRKASNATVYASSGTMDFISDKLNGSETVTLSGNSDPLFLGDLTVDVFNLSHDASEPLGYSVSDGYKRVTIITDSGIILDELYPVIADTDLLILEANYETNLLMMGHYPYELKRRIHGSQGHLSNEDAANCLCQMLEERKKQGIPKVYLAHLSKENNTPDQAWLTVKNILLKNGYYPDNDLILQVIERGGSTSLEEVV